MVTGGCLISSGVAMGINNNFNNYFAIPTIIAGASEIINTLLLPLGSTYNGSIPKMSIIFLLKDKDYKKYFQWDYFSDIDKEILIEITDYILEVKNVQQLSEEIHIKCPSWRNFWEKRKKDSKQNKMNFSFDIKFDNEDEEERKEIVHFYKESCYKNDKY